MRCLCGGQAATLAAGLVLMAVCPVVEATEVASWSAKTPLAGKGITLTRGTGPGWRAAEMGAVELLPIGDYFKRASFNLRLEKAVQGEVWLSVGFLDRGYGMVSVAVGAKGAGVSQMDTRGSAILNSGKVRHAVYRLAAGVDTRIVVTGVRYLHSVTVSDAEPAAEALPEAGPFLALTGDRDAGSPPEGNEDTGGNPDADLQAAWQAGGFPERHLSGDRARLQRRHEGADGGLVRAVSLDLEVESKHAD